MIKVNLLAVKKKKFRPVYFELLLFLIVIAALVFSFNLVVQGLNSKAQLIQTEIDKLNKEYRELQQVKREVDAFKQQKQELQSKIDIVEKLKQDQKGYYKILTVFEKAMPEDVWVGSISYDGKSINVSGSSLRTASVNEFIINLYKSKIFTNVNLQVVRKKTVENIDINDFSITADVRLGGA
ncbi:Fimbrial assembly family protein [Flexistipes sinusarabici DSM 4947]|uniref:Fimbrial assembly family protein n=1 Tax=Flexistipes sinusarabici (strain ATCC 49648 / DSM 4947 / MAS 10) TaxID=717231 RepID=F8E9E6_FLESM|nr:PilN domain-containing protein [Flexistipes sinusarabici]AEI14198.1 Fimbrial assembly family protein [Flexistipes sinusarabici DSM 4947]